MLFGTELLLELPVVFTSEKYADIHFICGFCDESGWVAIMEYHQWYSDNRVPHESAFQNVHRLLRETYSFSWMNIATAWRRQSFGYSALNLYSEFSWGLVLHWHRCRGVLHEDGFTSNVCKTVYLLIMPALLNFVSDCSYDCLIICSWIGLCLHILVLVDMEFLILGPGRSTYSSIM